jgi:hypothetical protein
MGKHKLKGVSADLSAKDFHGKILKASDGDARVFVV